MTHTHRTLLSLALGTLLAACAGAAPQMRLQRVVLYQNGVGYFERIGRVEGGAITLRLASHEVDDVLTTLTVVEPGADPDSARDAASPSAVVPEPDGEGEENEVRTLTLSLNDERPRDLLVAYAMQTPVWRTTYRVVLGDGGMEGADGGEPALLQAWAVVYNASPEDWRDVELSLATASPFSFRVDLRDREFADRPDVTGMLGGRGPHGPVFSSQGRAASASLDRDNDRILDVDDMCPDEPETYNGTEDEDGCPDRGSVIVEENSLRILEKVYFREGASDIQSQSVPILDATAATLAGNPHITRMRVNGHASVGEPSAWALSAERAGAVRAALIARGVEPERLSIQAFGDTMPIDPRNSSDAHERNRRAEFQILETSDGPVDGSTPATTARPGVRASGAAAGAGAAGEASVDASGATRYGLARHVTVPAGSSALVTVLNARIPGARVLLFRPERAVEGSGRHPMQAVRLENGEVDLVRGPVALFADGELLGEGLLEALPAGRTAYVPFGLDPGTDVTVETETDERPARILGLERGVLRVEHTQTLRSRYAIHAGRRAPAQLYLHHRTRAGYTAVELPPGSEPGTDAVIVPVPIVAERESALTVTERRPVERSLSLLNDLTSRLEPYLEGSQLAEADVTRLRTVVATRERARELSSAEARLRTELADGATRNGEVRASLRALDGAARNETTRRLRRELTERLDEGVRRVEATAGEIATARAEQSQAIEALREAVRAFTIAPPTTD